MHQFDAVTKLTLCLDTPFIGYLSLCGQEVRKIIKTLWLVAAKTSFIFHNALTRDKRVEGQYNLRCPVIWLRMSRGAGPTPSTVIVPALI